MLISIMMYSKIYEVKYFNGDIIKIEALKYYIIDKGFFVSRNYYLFVDDNFNDIFQIPIEKVVYIKEIKK